MEQHDRPDTKAIIEDLRERADRATDPAEREELMDAAKSAAMGSYLASAFLDDDAVEPM